MDTELQIYIGRLQEGSSQEINETLSADFIAVDEQDLKFLDPVKVHGKAYLADDYLVIELKIDVQVEIPCSVCNEKNQISINLPSFYHTEELVGIKGEIYDYAPCLREGILLEVPSYVECMGDCPERVNLKKYLNEKSVDSKDSGDAPQFPFADL